MGETALDEDTVDEYLIEMKNHYTADKVGFYRQLREEMSPNDRSSTTF